MAHWVWLSDLSSNAKLMSVTSTLTGQFDLMCEFVQQDIKACRPLG